MRKVIKITAMDSPNVRLMLEEKARGLRPSYRTVLEGVKGALEYETHRKTWDKVRQCVGLDAEFFEGAAELLFPPLWLNAAEEAARALRGGSVRRAGLGMGVDPAEGGDKTAFAVVDGAGLIHLEAYRTPDTNRVVYRARELIDLYGVPPERVYFDRGGGGKQHADRMRDQLGLKVKSVGFGETATAEPRRALIPIAERIEKKAERSAYRNLRAEMYANLSVLLDPSLRCPVFALPGGEAGEVYADLRRQLAVMRKLYNEEGQMYLPPKHRKEGSDARQPTLTELIGHSPDEADAVVLAVFGMVGSRRRATAGAH